MYLTIIIFINCKSEKCAIKSYRPSYPSAWLWALSPQLQFMFLVGEDTTLMAMVYRSNYHRGELNYKGIPMGS